LINQVKVVESVTLINFLSVRIYQIKQVHMGIFDVVIGKRILTLKK